MKRLTLLITFFAILLAAPASAQAAAGSQTSPAVLVYYQGPPGSLQTALSLAPGFQLVSDLAQAQVILLNGALPDPAILSQQVSSGAGLVLCMNEATGADFLNSLLGSHLAIETRTSPLSLVAGAESASFAKDIIWNSAPQIRERLYLSGEVAGLVPLAHGYEDDSLVLGRLDYGRGTIFIFTPYLNGDNPQFQEWAYYNYLIYSLLASAAGQTPLSFADYPASPVPHARQNLILLGMLAVLLVIAGLVFWRVRRYSLAHPELLDAQISDRGIFEKHQAHSDWEEVGFHRALGGFMLSFMLGLVLFIPLIIYQNLILPVYILPSAQALGIWGRVVQFFNFLWLLLDMGTSVAFIKFFSQYRVHNPRQAIQFGQVFVWWQALSGAVQVAIVTAVAGTVLPHTVYALYAWSVILHTAIQIPGFYQVMRHSLLAWQRFDYAQILEVSLYLVFPIITQPLIVTLMVTWGSTHPVFGSSMGGLLGLGIAAYAAEALTFFIGYLLYRRLGYNSRLLFLAHFDWSTVKAAFRFGVFEMLGSFAWAIGQAAEIVITQTRLVNYTEIWGNWGLAQNFIFAFNVVQTLFNNVMPSISEAISHARKVLSQYYTVMAYQWGGIISAFIGAVLLAVADRFILGASGPEFKRAAVYAIPLIIWGAIQYPSWVGDNVQLAANHPYLKSILVGAEQLVRIIFAYLLLERFQINALIIAYFIGLLSKGFAAYMINHRVCFPQRFYPWQSVVAPLLAAALHYFILRWVTGLIWQQDQVTSVLIFLLGILVSFPLYAFFYGFFGGWEDATLDELHHAVNLSSFMRPMAWLFWASTSLGARLSPLHGHFKISIRPEAMLEAQSLTRERIQL